MDTIQNAIVHEHITDLLREGEALRAERYRTNQTAEDDVGRSEIRGRPRRARVRLGHWLIGIGNALAGSADRSGGAAGHAV